MYIPVKAYLYDSQFFYPKTLNQSQSIGVWPCATSAAFV